MKSSLSWNKLIRTLSSGDYSPEAATPQADSPERWELMGVPVPIKARPSASFQWIDTVSDFLERHRKTALVVTGLVIIGTYGPAVKDVCHIAGEVMVIRQEVNSPLRRPTWVIELRRVMAQMKSRQAQSRPRRSQTPKRVRPQ